MKAIFIPGAACNSWIWRHTFDYLDMETVKLYWVTSDRFPCTHIDEVSNWLLKELEGISSPTDSVVAHSMGGLALLQLVRDHKIEFRHVIIVIYTLILSVPNWLGR